MCLACVLSCCTFIYFLIPQVMRERGTYLAMLDKSSCAFETFDNNPGQRRLWVADEGLHSGPALWEIQIVLV
jgi:hypothetical protein